MENWIISIIGVPFIAARFYFLKSVIASSGDWVKRALDEEVSAVFNTLVFLFLMMFWYTIPMALVALTCNAQLVTTLLLSVVVNEDHFAYVFLLLAPYKDSLKIMRVYAVFRTSFVMVASYSVFTLDGSYAKLFCTGAVAVFSVAMCTYRFIIIGLIIKTKSMNTTPFIICLFMFLAPALWFVFCLLQREVFAAVPNGFASVLGAVQLIMYAIYRDRDAHAKKPTANGSLEIEKGNVVSQVDKSSLVGV